MQLQTILTLLDATLVSDIQKDNEFHYAFASDLMSDVLSMVVDGEEVLLISGLGHSQTLRTAEMLDIHTVLFVRGKPLTKDCYTLSEACNIRMITTKKTMYEVCGLLYEAGLNPVKRA